MSINDKKRQRLQQKVISPHMVVLGGVVSRLLFQALSLRFSAGDNGRVLTNPHVVADYCVAFYRQIRNCGRLHVPAFKLMPPFSIVPQSVFPAGTANFLANGDSQDSNPNSFKSFSTVVIPAIPNFSTRNDAIAGDKNAGSVGPKWMFFTPSESNARRTITAFCSYHEML